MIEFENTIVVITAPMAGAGLPGGPMLDVNGKPLVLRAIETAEGAKLGKVLVATPDNRVAEAVRAAGGDALMVPRQRSSASDMAAAALALRDPNREVNFTLTFPAQLAAIPALHLSLCLAGIGNEAADLATLAAPFEAARDGLRRVIAPLSAERDVAYLRGLEPWSAGEDAGFIHVPVTAWKRKTLEVFTGLPASPREGQVGSEIVRALAGGLRCAAVKVDIAPLSVDTASDLEKVRRLLKA